MNNETSSPVNAPLITVITPSYNSFSFISQAIESVRAQTYTNWEMLIVDDHSTDHSPAIIKEFVKKDQRIRLLSTAQNSGAANARNIALNEAKGDYVAFLDSDDLWLPQKLEIQLAFMQKNKYAFSFTSYTMITEAGDPLNIDVQAPAFIDHSHLLGNTIIGCLTVMLDRRQIQSIQMPDVKPEDTALWLQLLKSGYHAHGLPTVLSKYRIVSNSVSRNKMKAACSYWKLIRGQEKLNFIKANYYFSKYAYNALRKSRGK